MQCRVGHVIGMVLCSVCRQPVLNGPDSGDQVAGQMNGVDSRGGQCRMRLGTDAGCLDGRLSLVPGRHPHAGRLADNAHPRPDRRRSQHIDQRAHPDAADLLVIGQRQMKRRLQLHRRRLPRRHQRRRDKPLHVRRAAAIYSAAFLGRLEGGPRPGLAVDRHHIRMSGQHHTGPVCRTDGGKQVRLGPLVILDDVAVHADIAQQSGAIVDQLAVGITADGGEPDQIGKDLSCGSLRHPRRPQALSRAGAEAPAICDAR